MSSISTRKKLTVGEQHQKAFDAMAKKNPIPIPEDFYKKVTEYFKTLTSYESVPIHIGKERDVSYDALVYALTHEYEYYVTFRTEEQDMYCPHPSYIIDDPKKEVVDDERSYFIGKPLEVINNYIYEKSSLVVRASYSENNHTCYLYGFQESWKEVGNFYDFTGRIEEKYYGDVLFITADDQIITHYTRFQIDQEKANDFYKKLANLFYRSNTLRIENMKRINHR